VTAADSLRAVAEAGGHAAGALGVGGPEVFEGWHEFYLLAGTAAVTLVGLLFVALSFNLDVLIHESRAHLLAHARSTLLTFSYLLVVSLGVLIPHQGVIMLGMLILIASFVFGTIHVVQTRRPGGGGDPRFERGMRRRGRIFLIGYGIAALSSAGMLATRTPQLLFEMVPVVCMMLGTAVGVAWDLLVEVGKMKAKMAGQSAPETRESDPRERVR